MVPVSRKTNNRDLLEYFNVILFYVEIFVVTGVIF
jgi:hypothetical protein